MKSLFQSKIRAVAFAASKKPTASPVSKIKKYATIHDFVSEDGGALQDRELVEVKDSDGISTASPVFGLPLHRSRRNSSAPHSGRNSIEFSDDKFVSDDDVKVVPLHDRGEPQQSQTSASTLLKTSSAWKQTIRRFFMYILLFLLLSLTLAGIIYHVDLQLPINSSSWSFSHVPESFSRTSLSIRQAAALFRNIPVWVPKAI